MFNRVKNLRSMVEAVTERTFVSRLLQPLGCKEAIQKKTKDCKQEAKWGAEFAPGAD